ncbi:hypothetical protein WH52_00325 [Tenacibaculum holothuriorum]|uniref:Uncharacterized protein n=1 Tax=Tenacibaculum holothuriorum TaxID=1635173 RepID=A0A1Y2PHI1_9FLAO|nr:hypothetical protein WH52_00325 [Tenacibaculum holothuriorum]
MVIEIRVLYNERIYIYLLTIIISLFSFQIKTTQKVFICKSTSSKRYHYKKTCRGLNRCKAEIKETTLKKAEKFGRTLCKLENK